MFAPRYANGTAVQIVADKTPTQPGESVVFTATVTAPLCTSANISGHPEGSIVSWNQAYAFGVERNIPLVVRAGGRAGRLLSDLLAAARSGADRARWAAPGGAQERRGRPQARPRSPRPAESCSGYYSARAPAACR